jgi:hypothetical protein
MRLFRKHHPFDRVIDALAKSEKRKASRSFYAVQFLALIFRFAKSVAVRSAPARQELF